MSEEVHGGLRNLKAYYEAYIAMLKASHGQEVANLNARYAALKARKPVAQCPPLNFGPGGVPYKLWIHRKNYTKLRKTT